MAIKTFKVLKDMKHPLYNNRMLRAGQPLELDAGTAALYQRLGVISLRGAVPAMSTENADQAAPKPKAPVKKKGAVPAMSTKNTGRTKKKS